MIPLGMKVLMASSSIIHYPCVESYVISSKMQVQVQITYGSTYVQPYAEQSLTPAERKQITRRMESSRDARRRADSTSSDSRGEGPSNTLQKGKTTDARNWGAVDIPDNELDPEAQQCELQMYSVEQSLRSNALDGYNSDEQHQMLEFWRTRKEPQPAVDQQAPPSPKPASRTTEAREAAPFVLDPFSWASRVEELSRELQSLKARTAATSSNSRPEPALKKKRSKRKTPTVVTLMHQTPDTFRTCVAS
ncbi:hypothetical protein VTO73DRAFT_1895 [Trametes versicolor]